MFMFYKKIRNKFTDVSECIQLSVNGKANGDILLSYGTEIYKNLNAGKSFPIKHSAGWENYQISKTFLDLGFNVDVIDFNNKSFIPKKNYVACIDVLSNLERLSTHLNKDCLNIFHPKWMHWAAHNRAIYQRLHNLQFRRGITLIPKKLLTPNLSIEHADYVTQRGNRTNQATYDYAGKKSFNVRHSSNVQYDFPVHKDFNNCRRNFLWLGGFGLVAKGLDLVLEAFAEMPEYHLTVCGPIQKEKDFEQVYYKELFETPNINTKGFIDITSDEFIELTNYCVGFIYPSCAELSCGSTITCAHFGLIPIVTPEASIDSGDSEFILEDCSIDSIRKAVINLSSIPQTQLKELSLQIWKYARNVHTRDNFSKDYRNAIMQILS